MPVYAITFRIADQDYAGFSYDDRYRSLLEALKELKPNLAWVDPTSFFLFEIAKPARMVLKHIEAKAIEPRRVCRRLRLLRGWSHGQAAERTEVFT